jgi:hypothetical protein
MCKNEMDLLKYTKMVKQVLKSIFSVFWLIYPSYFGGLQKNGQKTAIPLQIFLKFSEMVGRELLYQEIPLAEMGIFF